MPRVSLKNIAEKIGVSNATVSLVLNGKAKDGRVSKELSEKILQTAKEMNYSPNTLARGLRIGKSKIIGLIVADITNNFFANLAFHIQEYAEQFGYTVIIANTSESEEKMKKRLNILRNQQVDGFIIVPTESSRSEIEELLERKIPVVLLDRYFPTLETTHVSVDNYHASCIATKYLIANNCKRIATLVYKSELHHMQERKRGYMEVLKQNDIYDASLVKEISFESIEEDITNAINTLMDDPQKVDGIFFTTNSVSLIGIRQLLALKKKIPDDVRVVCFDKSNAFDFSGFHIPYIMQPIPEMGKRAAALLIEEIEKEETKHSKNELFPTLMNI